MTPGNPFETRDTVCEETPATRATSAIDAFCVRRGVRAAALSVAPMPSQPAVSVVPRTTLDRPPQSSVDIPPPNVYVNITAADTSARRDVYANIQAPSMQDAWQDAWQDA
ncbi:hypothetical protein GCM10010431_77160 [Streptomyces kunmingensis]